MFNSIEGSGLDLHTLVVEHPAATFFVRAGTDALQNEGIRAQDILVVDRSLQPKKNSLVITLIEGEFCVLRLTEKKVGLHVWGVITYVIHKVR